MAFERSDLSGEWQLPQGGIEHGEIPAGRRRGGNSSRRPGSSRTDVSLVDEWDGWTVYLWPEEMRRSGRLGQVHRWFFFEPLHDDVAPEPDGSEFGRWSWMSVPELIERVVDFRKAPYRQVLGG